MWRIDLRRAGILASLLSLSLCAQSKVDLWPRGIPGAKVSATYIEEIQGTAPVRNWISKVSHPELEIYLPQTGSGSAVVICPGGGYSGLAFEHEGVQVARWLNQQGVAAFILKYRMPSDETMEKKAIGPLQDVQEALRMVRRRAAEFHVKPDRIGIMGFSAGGHLAASLSTRYAEPVYVPLDATSARPDFSILVYGVLSMQSEITHMGSQESLLGKKATPSAIGMASNERRVDASTPPAFLIHCQDDDLVPVENSIRYFQALSAFGVPAELHLYPKGGHGFGLGKAPNSPAQWTDGLKAWMKGRGLI